MGIAPEWHNVIAFGPARRLLAATLTKGAHIEVERSLRSRERLIETAEGPITIRSLSIPGRINPQAGWCREGTFREQQPTEENREP